MAGETRAEAESQCMCVACSLVTLRVGFLLLVWWRRRRRRRKRRWVVEEVVEESLSATRAEPSNVRASLWMAVFQVAPHSSPHWCSGLAASKAVTLELF